MSTTNNKNSTNIEEQIKNLVNPILLQGLIYHFKDTHIIESIDYDFNINQKKIFVKITIGYILVAAAEGVQKVIDVWKNSKNKNLIQRANTVIAKIKSVTNELNFNAVPATALTKARMKFITTGGECEYEIKQALQTFLSQQGYESRGCQLDLHLNYIAVNSLDENKR